VEHIRLEGLLYPEGGQWLDDDTWLPPRPAVGGVPVAFRRIPAAEIARRLDRLAALDAPPRHLALRDLLPLLTAPKLETSDRPLRVLRLCDLAPADPATGPAPLEADLDRNQARGGTPRGKSSWLALLTGVAPPPVPETRLPAVLCGPAAHLAARLGWLATRSRALRRRWRRTPSVLALWLVLSALPADAPPHAVAAALGLIAPDGGR
jgi:hypothetical protein